MLTFLIIHSSDFVCTHKYSFADDEFQLLAPYALTLLMYLAKIKPSRRLLHFDVVCSALSVIGSDESLDDVESYTDVTSTA